MEKEIGSKEVKMHASANPEGKASGTMANGSVQKLGYEELNQACAEMSQQIQQQDRYIQQMRRQMQEMSFMLQNKRMDYLFRVVEVSNNYKSSDYPCFDKLFVEECLSEIQASLTIHQQGEEEETHKKD